jgi:hypothetical protein
MATSTAVSRRLLRAGNSLAISPYLMQGELCCGVVSEGSGDSRGSSGTCSIRKPLLAASANGFAELVGSVGPIFLAGRRRRGLPHSLCPSSQAEGMIGPVAGGSANFRCPEPVLQAILQHLGIFSLRCGGTCISGDCGESPQLSPQSPERPIEPIALHGGNVSTLDGVGCCQPKRRSSIWFGGFESGRDLLHDLRQRVQDGQLKASNRSIKEKSHAPDPNRQGQAIPRAA